MRNTVENLELLFQNICRKSVPYEWDENHITFLLMQELRSVFSNRRINFNGWSKIVNWQSFKNRGKQETIYGDMALLVNIQFTSGEILKGVANIEAKRDFEAKFFASIDLDQLNRIWSNAPYSHLLLYNQAIQNIQLKFPDERTWQSHLWVSPINTAKELLVQTSVNENKKVLRTSFPFSMFLTSRIFWGFDLDYRKDLYEDISIGINRLINPQYLGVINVFYDNQRPIDVDLADIWEEI